MRWDDIATALRRTAGRRILIVDTCYARSVEGRADLQSLAKRSAASRFALLLASQSHEESQEYPPPGTACSPTRCCGGWAALRTRTPTG